MLTAYLAGAWPALSKSRICCHMSPLPAIFGIGAQVTFSCAAAWIASYSCLRDDADEVADLHDLRVRDVGDRLRVDRQHLRVHAVVRGTLPARPDRAAVQHPGDPDVVHVRVGAVHLRRDVEPMRAQLADQLVLVDRFHEAREAGARPAPCVA